MAEAGNTIRVTRIETQAPDAVLVRRTQRGRQVVAAAWEVVPEVTPRTQEDTVAVNLACELSTPGTIETCPLTFAVF